jgi:antitoxin component YwqK of YwqJK toxin-antitoxin module
MKVLWNFSFTMTLMFAVLHPLTGRKPSTGNVFSGQMQSGCYITNLSASSVRETRAALSYKVRGAQVAEFGVCYGKDPSPDVKTGLAKTSFEGEPRDIPSDVAFKISVTGLEPDTEYHVRGYAKDGKGNFYYSPEISFTTVKEQDFSSVLNGPRTEYYPNGMVMKRYTVKNGVPEGSFKFYSDSGYMVSDQTLSGGMQNGSQKTYYSDGTLRSDINYRDGRAEGAIKEYYPNGNIKTDGSLTGEPFKQTGVMKSYFEEGGLMSETTISGGQPVHSKSYDQEGRTTREESPGMNVSYSYDTDGWKHTSVNGEGCNCSRCNQ